MSDTIANSPATAVSDSLSLSDCLSDCLTKCLTLPTETIRVADLAAWRGYWLAALAGQGPGSGSVDLACRAGFHSDRVAWAFLAGYQSAIGVMVPGRNPEKLGSFSVTESGGNQPRHISTTVETQADGSIRINGEKRWVAMGHDCDELLIAATMKPPGESESAAAAQGGPAIRMIALPRETDGLSIISMPPMEIIPEVPHSGVRFSDVILPASALLPGDGYSGFVKPFRTLEDIHIAAAVLAYLLRSARRLQWPPAFSESLAALIVALYGLSRQAPDAATTHVALSGVLTQVHAAYEQASILWREFPDDEESARWVRDRPLFGLATKVRAARAGRAWERLQH